MRNRIIGISLATLLLASQAHADVSICPKVADIKASAFKSDNPNIPAPYNAGFQYTATTSSNKKWHGETIATADSYLEKKYELKPESVDDQTAKIVCSYGGKTVEDGDTTSTPYLKMISEK